jgi:hypothetical protein
MPHVNEELLRGVRGRQQRSAVMETMYRVRRAPADTTTADTTISDAELFGMTESLLFMPTAATPEGRSGPRDPRQS